ncbi:hypothetical protein GCM10017784_38300 [Deinococcus indicus]|jgi:GNAT superfamily N-acetyltransferase|uniref:hypothetical protein n=1 Tax=Deinococcus TaxID=1298 RepID=UPI0006DC75D9|nr:MULTISPECIES: hypothetical protein [Deinococcus]PIG95965.1 hypothetical protein AMD26_018935 [Deinococcus sp. UR1]GHG39723.1 hypothetical protein GCM10017784_38300 [Deinococcus indicus]
MFEHERGLTLPNGLTVRLSSLRAEDSALWRIYPVEGSLQLAKVNTTVRDGWLHLNDIHVTPQVTRPSATWWRRVRGRQDIIPVRGQGLGGLLLTEVQREAVRRGLQGVRGTFTPETPAASLALARFYQRHGFTLTGIDLQWVPGG